MGEIADMMINGDLDAMTGEYLGPGHGYPRTGNGSLPWEKGILNRKRGQRFYRTEFTPQNKKQGVEFWLYDKGHRKLEDAHEIIRKYVTLMGWEVGKKRFITNSCVKIQEDFPAFCKWYNSQVK